MAAEEGEVVLFRLLVFHLRHIFCLRGSIDFIPIKNETRLWYDILCKFLDLTHSDFLFKLEVNGVLLISIQQGLRFELIDVDVCYLDQYHFIEGF